MRRIGVVVPALLALAAMVMPAAARSLTGTPFDAGFLEPVETPVHLLGLMAVGLLAVQAGGAAVWQMPVAGVVAALVAGGAAAAGLALPHGGTALMGSLVLVGGIVATGRKTPVLVALVVGALHGYVQSGSLGFWAGVAVSVVFLMAAGIGVAAMLMQAGLHRIVMMCGGLVALWGVLNLVRVFTA